MKRIPINKIKKLFDPFNSMNYIFKHQQYPFSISEINSFIESSNIFADEEDTVENKWKKMIAYEIINPSNNPIIIDLSKVEADTLDEIITGIPQLAAAIYKKDLYIDAHVKGGDNVIKSLLGKVQEVEDVIINDINKSEVFNWAINEKFLINRWLEENYVIEKIEEYAQNIKFIPKELWENEKIIKKVLEVASMDLESLVAPEILCSEIFIKVASDSPYIINLFESIYKNIISDEYSPYKKEVFTFLKNYFFDNIDNVINKSDHSINKYNIDSILPYIDKNKFKNEKLTSMLIDLLETSNKSYCNNDYIEYFPSEYFSKIDNVIAFMKATKKRFHNSIESKYSKLYNDFIKYPEKILELAQKEPKVCKYFSSVLKNHLKNKDFVEKLLNLAPNFYEDLSKELQKDEKLLSIFINKSHDISSLSSDVYPILNRDPELLKLYITKFPKALFAHNAPKKWRENIELMLNISDDFYWHSSDIPKKVLNELCKNTAWVNSIIDNKNDNYTKLPLSVKENVDFAISYLKNDGKSYNIPKKLWLNKEFCLKVLEIGKEDYIKNIPIPFFKNKDFVYEFAKLLDSEEISKNIFKFLPNEIAIFFDTYGVTENYLHAVKSVDTHRKLDNNINQNEVIRPKRKI